VPTAEEGPAPAWLEGEGMPSGDEALAWLAQLAAGKEEELQAQAEAEAEARLAEIMGRPQIEEAPPVEAAPEEAVAPPVEEPFGWTAFGEPEAPPAPVEAVEEAPPVEEIAPPEMPEPAYLEEAEAPPAVEFPVREEAPLPEEIPTPEAAPPTEEVHWGAVLEPAPEMEGAPAPVVEEIPGVVEMELAGPPEEPIAPPEIPIAETAAVELPAEPFAAERGYLKDHPRDYEAWLALARALWQTDERQESLETYTRVIRAGKLLDSVTADLEGYVRQWRDASTQRVLGDAYMKDGRLQKALNTYRRALETL
jgi:tetratricopeptide (TPR) repeat protein